MEFALSVLKDFYTSQGTSFVQQRAAYVPPNSDREGKTVGDLAPKVFNSAYHGDLETSKGILGLLEVILSDFERTQTTVAQQETMSQAEFNAFKAANEADTAAKNTEVDTRKTALTAVQDELVSLKGQLHDATSAYELAVLELQQLRSTCVEGEETYEQRVEKRMKEVEALKQALKVLEDWQR